MLALFFDMCNGFRIRINHIYFECTTVLLPNQTITKSWPCTRKSTQFQKVGRACQIFFFILFFLKQQIILSHNLKTLLNYYHTQSNNQKNKAFTWVKFNSIIKFEHWRVVDKPGAHSIKSTRWWTLRCIPNISNLEQHT